MYLHALIRTDLIAANSVPPSPEPQTAQTCKADVGGMGGPTTYATTPLTSEATAIETGGPTTEHVKGRTHVNM